MPSKGREVKTSSTTKGKPQGLGFMPIYCTVILKDAGCGIPDPISREGPRQMKRTRAVDGRRWPRWKLLGACCGLLLVVSAARAQEARISLEERAKLEAAVSRFMAANSIPGLSAAVVQNGKYLWSGGFGMADLENFVPATEETLYRLGSVSKPLTAVGAMELWERGKLDLDAPVQKYCPAFPPKDSPISTRAALGHLAGIPHYKSDAEDDPEVYNIQHFDDPIASGLKFFANDPLVSKPGTHFN